MQTLQLLKPPLLPRLHRARFVSDLIESSCSEFPHSDSARSPALLGCAPTPQTPERGVCTRSKTPASSPR